MLGQPSSPRRGEPVPVGVLPQRRHQRLGHSLLLHPQEIEHVEPADDVVEIMTDINRPAADFRGQQGRRSDEGDVGPEHRERLDVAAGHSGMLDVANDGDFQPVKATGAAEGSADREAIEQRLGGVLMPAVTGIDNACISPLAELPGHPRRLMPHDKGVDPHRRERLDGVAQTLALVDARRRRVECHRVGREAFRRRLEAQPSASRVLEEQADHVLAAQRRHLGNRAGVDLGHVLRQVHQADHCRGIELLDRPEMLHDTLPAGRVMITPSGPTCTSSSRRVGRFLPT